MTCSDRIVLDLYLSDLDARMCRFEECSEFQWAVFIEKFRGQWYGSVIFNDGFRRITDFSISGLGHVARVCDHARLDKESQYFINLEAEQWSLYGKDATGGR